MTSRQDNPCNIGGVEVKAISDWEETDSDYLMIVSVAENMQDEILKEVASRKIGNIMLIKDIWMSCFSQSEYYYNMGYASVINSGIACIEQIDKVSSL